MTRSSCLVLTAGVTVLGAASVATADLVTQPVYFNLNFSGFYPGTIDDWFIEHDFEVTYDDDDATNNFVDGEYKDVDATFDVGGEQIVVTLDFQNQQEYGQGKEFGMRYVIPDAPFGFGPMEIEMFGQVWFEGNIWTGSFEASISSGSGFFGDGEIYDDVDFSAAVIPAPGAIALFGLAGLSGRRRRD